MRARHHGAMTDAPTRTSTVDRLLDVIAAGAGCPEDLLAPGAVLDATVPGWRFTVRGAAAVARKYGEWFDHPGTLEELERLPVDGGEVVTYLVVSSDRGVPFAAHHCHRLRFDAEGRIESDRFFCGGRWDAARLAEMASADHAG